MDTHSPAKTKGTIAAGQSWPAHGTTRKLAVRVTPLLPFTGSMERSVSGGCIAPRHPLSTNKSLTRTDCVHRLKIPSQGTRKLLHHMLMSSTKTEGEGERKKKKSSAFSCDMDQGKARLLTPEESPISLLGCNPSEQMGSTSRRSRQI